MTMSCGLSGRPPRDKLLTMRWSDIDLDTGLWRIPHSPREKNNGGPELILPKLALDILRRQPCVRGSELVFTISGKKISISHAKRGLLAKLPPMPQWGLHDARRTSRSLMARIGIDPQVAERVLGHRVGNAIERTYNRHSFTDEKAAALARLAALVSEIVSGEVPDKKIVPIRARS
jgi:integrase